MDFANNIKYDNILLDIIQDVDKLPNFLDIMFGFLRRRTDLFYILSNEQQKVGFLPGNAEKLIIKAFQKHKFLFESSLPSLNTKNDNKITQKVIKNNEIKKKNSAAVNVNLPKDIIADSCKTTESAASELYVQDSECYNGAMWDKYSWSQTIDELDIRVNTPPFVNSSKQVKVHVGKKYLSVSVKEEGTESFVSVIEGDLCWEVRNSDLIWSFDPADSKVLIALEKTQERWWDAFFVGEATIDTRAIDCSRPMTDLDDEAQAKIHKMMYDNQQKQLGFPTSEEQRVNDVLRSAWSAENSPFKDQPFDPSQIDIIGNTGSM